MTLKFRRLPDMGKARCHECGREWWEVLRPPDGPDPRPFVEFRGVFGCCQIFTILCPHCMDDHAATLFDAASLRHIYAANVEYDREMAVDLMLRRLPMLSEAFDEPEVPSPIKWPGVA